MSYPYTKKLIYPLKNYKVNGLKFGGKYSGWGIHLGEDILSPTGTEIKAIGKGRVVYSALHPGTKVKGNWGNIIILAHKNPKTRKIFFSLYGHLEKRIFEKGAAIKGGEIMGVIGKANTPQNGWWPEEHLHFAIYTGPWKGKVLPGYFRKGDKQNKISFWKKPGKFIQNYK